MSDFNKNDVELCRVNVNLERKVKEWLSWHAKTMGMSMSQLCSFLITQYYNNNLNQETMRTLKEVVVNPEFQANNKEFLEAMAAIIDATQSHD